MLATGVDSIPAELKRSYAKERPRAGGGLGAVKSRPDCADKCTMLEFWLCREVPKQAKSPAGEDGAVTDEDSP